jgi:hypothetical protein
MASPKKHHADASAEPQKIDEISSGETDLGSGKLQSESTTDDGPVAPSSERPHPKVIAALHKLRKLEERAIELPFVGKLPAPEKHDAAYVAGMAALLVFGAVELPIALIFLGGHVLVKQHHSRALGAIGEVMEDVWGHQV